MSIGESLPFRSRAAAPSLATRLLCALMVVALCFAGFVTPMPAAAAATPAVDCASMHAGPDGDAQRAAPLPDAPSCCLFHCIPAVPLLAAPVAEPVRPSLRVRLGENERARGVTPAIVVPPPRA
ncbi:hypothetical protein [Aureimonas pseudogalii]|uniref:DUF2946 domain-containing protein n=1 Tax=Aureimonas pseudogalii TaxID=1744844 RepID=A0A7W6EDH0_9HYPH|nr:hypothetical protein [Aureimonas pseudogalii]MBB3998036.1 hypothetical protein [Aureimonas pseudogalii]